MKQEKRFLQNKQGTGRTSEVVEKDNKRRASLDEQISEISFELDEIRTKMLSDKKTEKSIGKFYIKWALLEREIVKLGEKHNITTISIQFSSGIVMRKLSEGRIIESEIYSNYQSIRRFRNNIAHGLTTPTNKELETNLVSLDVVLTKIQDLILIK
ncbi:MAG: hypothetical protein IIA82_02755 [Thaumarchaeota archaeon]|nr:hypothetical protein [Nitrososphaerota archaeon]